MIELDLSKNPKFDYETHVKYFTNYCEVIILEDGTIEYAIPSHQDKLIEIYRRKYPNMTNQEVKDLVPIPESIPHWLACKLNAIIVITDVIIKPVTFTETQQKSLYKLVETGCIRRITGESIIELRDNNRVYEVRTEWKSENGQKLHW